MAKTSGSKPAGGSSEKLPIEKAAVEEVSPPVEAEEATIEETSVLYTVVGEGTLKYNGIRYTRADSFILDSGTARELLEKGIVMELE